MRRSVHDFTDVLPSSSASSSHRTPSGIYCVESRWLVRILRGILVIAMLLAVASHMTSAQLARRGSVRSTQLPQTSPTLDRPTQLNSHMPEGREGIVLHARAFFPVPPSPFTGGILRTVPQQYATIQTAIDAASNGDTVLVSEGIYYENISFRGKAIIVASTYLTTSDTSHISRTIIDGSRPSHPDSGSVVSFINGEDTNSVLCGFSIRGGTGTTHLLFDGVWARSGGGVFCESAGARLVSNLITRNSVVARNACGGGIAAQNFKTSFPFIILESNRITDNLVQGDSLGWAGGAFVLETSTRIAGNVFEKNGARGFTTRGGAVYVRGKDAVGPFPDALVQDNIFQVNTVEEMSGGSGGAKAGGMYLVWTDESTVKNNLFEGNAVKAVVGFAGGGGLSIYDSDASGYGRKVVIHNRFLYNTVESQRGGSGSCGGGGLLLQGTSATIADNLLSSNTARSPQEGNGGGCQAVDANFRLEGNIIRNNSVANIGGAVDFGSNLPQSTEQMIINNIIENNTATNGGGGISMWGSRPAAAINNTIVGNRATYAGGGIVIWETVELLLFNSIVWNNMQGTTLNQIYNPSIPGQFQYNDIQGGWIGEGNIDIDPRFATDSYPPSYRLLDTSDCIGRGRDSVLFRGVWYRAPNNDVYGNVRPNPAGSNPDLGACENRLSFRSFPARPVTAPPLPVGTYTVGAGGYFANIDSAFDRLSGGGILGPVTFLLTDTLYVASPARENMFKLTGPIAGAGPSSRITIRPADNVTTVIQGSGWTTLYLVNASYITIDGIAGGPTGFGRLTVRALYNSQVPWNDAIDIQGNSDFIYLQNMTVRSDDARLSSGIWFFSSPAGGPDSCLISRVFVPSAFAGVWVTAYDYFTGGGALTSFRPKGFVIRDSRIGSPEDNKMSWGIDADWTDDILIEQNTISNLKASSGWGLDNGLTTIGIVALSSLNGVIRDNVVCALRGSGETRVWGIVATRVYSSGTGLKIFNNMIYDLKNSGTTSPASTIGIHVMRDNPNVLVAHNSVFLNDTSAVPDGISALRLGASVVSGVTIKNNIFINTSKQNTATVAGMSDAIRLNGGLAAIVGSDYNDLFVGPYSTSRLVQAQSLTFESLAKWQLTGFDAHSVSVNPVFTAPHLHIDTTASVNAALAHAGTSIPGMDFDFDGDRRPAIPDIGADQFSRDTTSTDIEEGSSIPSSFALEQNYPNPFNAQTVVRYQVSVVSMVDLRVYDLLGREMAVLMNEERPAGKYSVSWNAHGMASGIYYYQLKAGGNVFTKKMILLR
jgi:hypothetical protein